MTDEEQRELAVKTALDFIANEAAFIPIPENSAVMIWKLDAAKEQRKNRRQRAA